MEILKNLKNLTIKNNKINQYIIDFNLDNKLSIEEIKNLDFFYIEEIKKILPKIEVIKPNGEIVILNEIKIKNKDYSKYRVYIDIEIVIPEDIEIAIKNKYSDLYLIVGDKEVCFYNGGYKYNFEDYKFDAGFMVEYNDDKKAIVLEINNLLDFTHKTKLIDVFDVEKVTIFQDTRYHKNHYFINVDIISKNNNDICYDLELRFSNNFTVKTSGKIKYLEFFRNKINELLKRTLAKLLSLNNIFTSDKQVDFNELNNKLYFCFNSSVEKAFQHKVIKNINIHDIEFSIIRENLEKKQNKKNNILLNLKTISDNINNLYLDLDLKDLEDLDNEIIYWLNHKVKHELSRS